MAGGVHLWGNRLTNTPTSLRGAHNQFDFDYLEALAPLGFGE